MWRHYKKHCPFHIETFLAPALAKMPTGQLDVTTDPLTVTFHVPGRRLKKLLAAAQP
jgi:hypothetical protein